jgi:hypothetical protein
LFILTLFTQSTIAAADDVEEYDLDQFLQFFAVFKGLTHVASDRPAGNFDSALPNFTLQIETQETKTAGEGVT